MLVRLLIYCAILLVSSLVSVMEVSAQTVAPHFRQLSTDDGLPSSEVYFVMEDSKGFMWFGTDNGVARFDGYEFTVFDSKDGLEDVVVFKLMEDYNGVIWVSTLSGKLFYYTEGKFHEWEHNQKLDELRNGNYYLKLAHIDREGNFYIYGGGSKLFVISEDGKMFYQGIVTERELELFSNETTLSDSSQSVWNTQIKTLTDRNFVLVKDISIWETGEGGQKTEVTEDYSIAKLKGAKYAFSITQPSINPEGEFLLFSRNQVSWLKKGKLPKTVVADNRGMNYAFSSKKGKYWACMTRGKGLIHYNFSDSSNPVVDTTLIGRSVSYGTYDSKGGLWLTTLEAGVYYASHPNLSLYSSKNEVASEKAFSLAMVNDHIFFAGYGDGNINLWNVKSKSVTTLPVINADIFPINWLTYLPQNEKLYMGGGYYINGSSITGKGYEKRSYASTQIAYSYGVYDPIYDPSTIYLMSYFFSAKLALNRDSIYSYSEDRGIYNLQSILPINDDELLFGTISGLKEVNELGKLELSERAVGVLAEERITQMVKLPHDAILYGTRGKGIVFQNSDTTYAIGRSKGLASDMIRDIHRATDGTVWVASLAGISSLKFDEYGRYSKLRTFGLEHGLPDLEVQDIDSYGDQIWLATAKGIAKFDQPAIDSVVSKPYIETFFLNATSVDIDSVGTFPAGRQDIDLSFGAVNYQMRGDIPFRYRISSKDEWQFTKQRTVNYPNLNPGDYTFEVQSQNQDGYWSESTVLPFTIKNFWYHTWWARLGFLFLLFLSFGLFFYIRERRHREEQVFLRQINDLERSAVQAQMNPHFIFNSLNSIQYFVLHNDIKQAAIYLSRFASLIRKTLRASVGGEHYLSEEIALLEGYLALEKLRFKDNFTYHLDVDDEIDPEKVKIFPLLIQPFVENAIIHGLKEIDKDGSIIVRFRKVNHEMQVDIIDNGSGFDPDQEMKSSSLGMSITRRRLEMMKKMPGTSPRMQIGPMYDENGNKTGTRATLRVII